VPVPCGQVDLEATQATEAGRKGAEIKSVRHGRLALNPKPTLGFTSTAHAVALPKLKPWAVREAFVVPSIGGRDVACAERPNIRRFEHFL
jgi:hypothetical protein